MFGNLNGWHLIILLVVILLLFGAAKLPALAKSMGQSARVFKGEMKAMKASRMRPTRDCGWLRGAAVMRLLSFGGVVRVRTARIIQRGPTEDIG